MQNVLFSEFQQYCARSSYRLQKAGEKFNALEAIKVQYEQDTWEVGHQNACHDRPKQIDFDNDDRKIRLGCWVTGQVIVDFQKSNGCILWAVESIDECLEIKRDAIDSGLQSLSTRSKQTKQQPSEEE